MCLAQRADRRGRHGDTPVAAGVGGRGVGDAVKANGNRRPFWLVADPGKQQILAFLSRIDHIIRRQGIDSDFRRHGVDHYVYCATAGITGAIGHRDVNGPGPVCQTLYNGGWQAEAPVPRRIHHGGVLHVIQGDGHQVTRCRTGDRPAQDLRL